MCVCVCVYGGMCVECRRLYIHMKWYGCGYFFLRLRCPSTLCDTQTLTHMVRAGCCPHESLAAMSCDVALGLVEVFRVRYTLHLVTVVLSIDRTSDHRNHSRLLEHVCNMICAPRISQYINAERSRRARLIKLCPNYAQTQCRN